ALARSSAYFANDFTMRNPVSTFLQPTSICRQDSSRCLRRCNRIDAYVSPLSHRDNKECAKQQARQRCPASLSSEIFAIKGIAFVIVVSSHCFSAERRVSILTNALSCTFWSENDNKICCRS